MLFEIFFRVCGNVSGNVVFVFCPVCRSFVFFAVHHAFLGRISCPRGSILGFLVFWLTLPTWIAICFGPPVTMGFLVIVMCAGGRS